MTTRIRLALVGLAALVRDTRTAVVPSATSSLLAAEPVAATPRPIALVHIEKTGGSSVEDTLGLKPGGLPTPECAGVPVVQSDHNHLTAAQQQADFGIDLHWKDAYKIAFVRNPWDRLVSLWAFDMQLMQLIATPGSFIADAPPATATELLLEECGCGLGEVAEGKASPQNTDPSMGNASYTCSFTTYITKCAGLTRDFTHAVGWNNVTVNVSEVKNNALLTQMDYLTDESGMTTLSEKNSLVDFVGRTENLCAHMEAALIGAGHNATVARECAYSMTSSSVDWHAPSQDYYGSEQTLKAAAKLFEVDINAFGYVFNGTSPMNVVFQKASRGVMMRPPARRTLLHDYAKARRRRP